MDSQILKREFRKDITFWGAIDTQKILPFETEKDIAEEIKRKIDDLARGGGFVLETVHAIRPDVSPKNILFLLKDSNEYGTFW